MFNYLASTCWLIDCALAHYLVYPDTKHLQEVTFYVASNNSSVFLSCMTTLALGLINLTLDWTIFQPEPILLLAVLIILRKPSPKSVFMFLRKSLKHLFPRVWFPSSFQTRNTSLPIILMFFDGIGHFPGPHTISRLILVSHQNRLPDCQSLCRSFEEGDWQDVTSRCFEACEPSNSLDQQLCTSRGQG